MEPQISRTLKTMNATGSELGILSEHLVSAERREVCRGLGPFPKCSSGPDTFMGHTDWLAYVAGMSLFLPHMGHHRTDQVREAQDKLTVISQESWGRGKS